MVPLSHVEAGPSRDLFQHRKHKFSGVSVSLRDDLIERIDKLADKEVPYSSRSAVVAMLLTLGLQEWDRRQEKPPTNRILSQG